MKKIDMKPSEVFFKIAQDAEKSGKGIQFICWKIADIYGWNENKSACQDDYIPIVLSEIIQEDLNALAYSLSGGDSNCYDNNFFSIFCDNVEKLKDAPTREKINQARVTYCYLLAHQLEDIGQ
jgi:hypothetical protein